MNPSHVVPAPCPARRPVGVYSETRMSIEIELRALVREEVKRLLPELLPGQDEYLNTKEVAELTGLSVSFFEVGRSMSSPDQPSYRKIGRRVLYRRADVLKWMESRRRGQK